jgi:NAD(P)-dependent dehydrogenase (short-subunit alcohol dehydrogenase family)
VQVAVVTGAGRGLGRKIAERLARRRIHVVCTDIDEGAARTTAAIADGTGMGQDVRDPESHRAVALEARKHGELVIWVNNAGVLAVGDTWTLTDRAVRQIVEVNLLGVMWGCHAAVDAMTRGTIVNIASLSSLAPAPGLAVYSGTKHGVLGYSLSLAGELRRAKKPITVSALCPDAIAGDMTAAVAKDPAAAILFSSGAQLTLDDVADAAVGLVDRPRLVRTIPAFRAAMVHALRPFPQFGLPLLAQFAKLGRRKQH